MTNYQLEKLAKRIASEILRKVAEDENLLDAIIPPKCLSAKEAAEYTRIPINTLYNKCSEIPHMKVGKRLVFTDRALIKWMKREQREVRV